MILEILPKGLLGGRPVIMEASLVIVKTDKGNITMVSGEFGPGGTVRSSHGLDADFKQTLHQLGIDSTTIKLSNWQEIKLPEPPTGAKLIAGPQGHSAKEWPE